MKTTILLLVFIILLFCGNGYTDCREGCTTTITLKDCDGDSVENADVTISICCGNNKTITKATGADGRVKFNYCLADICGKQIVCDTGTGKIENCTIKNQNDAECVIKICSDSK
ncbi:MAG: hypothetical protein QG657_5303 [Acidobacteriota bacterium]|nr:hypothetical protein [Acidobacteriota bacterium]